MNRYTNFCELMLFIIFCYCGFTSVRKYQSGKVSIFVELQTMKDLDYGSMSICPYFAFKKNLEDLMFKNETIVLDDVQKLVDENVWKRNETFYFVSYPTNEEPGYECLTTKGSVDNKKPCIFPFKWHNKCKLETELNGWFNIKYQITILAYSTCTIDGNVERWCVTKTSEDGEVAWDTTKRWGLCEDRCTGKFFAA